MSESNTNSYGTSPNTQTEKPTFKKHHAKLIHGNCIKFDLEEDVKDDSLHLRDTLGKCLSSLKPNHSKLLKWTHSKFYLLQHLLNFCDSSPPTPSY